MNKEYITKSILKTKGWTDKGIDLFLQTHDKETKNPVFRTASPMKLYLKTRVEEIEQTKAFQEFQIGNEARKNGSKKSIETKKNKLLKEICDWKIHLKYKDIRDIRKNAIYSYNKFKGEMVEEFGNYDFTPATTDSDSVFLNRVIVNYLRHNLSNYDSKLDDIFGKVGKSEAYRIINTKIYAKIAEVYPVLKDECDNQLISKLDETNNQI